MTTEPGVPHAVRRIDRELAHAHSEKDRLTSELMECDQCIKTLDARKAGFGALVIEDACRGIDADGSLARAWKDMLAAGVKRITSADISV